MLEVKLFLEYYIESSILLFAFYNKKIFLGGAPIINPTTGQPDYSAQWAEYYRTMGMHEQANMIEVNMRQQQVQPMGVPQQQPQGAPQGAGTAGRYYNA